MIAEDVDRSLPDPALLLEHHTVPDGLVRARCCVCGGNVLASEGELACMMCGRGLVVAAWARSADGAWRIASVCLPEPPDHRAPTSIGHMAARRVTRTLARDAGTSRAATVLKAVPSFPGLVTASQLSRSLSLSKGEVEQTLGELMGARKVKKAIYDPTYFYVGYYRPVARS